MYPYFLVFSLTLIFIYLSQIAAKKGVLGERLFIFIGTSLLVCLAAFRHQWVGTDTGTYLWFWNNLQPLNDQGADWLYSEPLFGLLQQLTRFIADDSFLGHEVFLGAISALVCTLTLSSIMQLSKNKVLSVFIFLFLGFYLYHFNGARQAIAMAFFLYSIKYILNGNIKKYVLIVFVGFLFHKTMLITAPFYFLFRRDFTPKIVMIIVFSTIVAAFSMSSLVEFATEFDSRYKNYASSDFAGGGLIQVLFFSVIMFWLYASKKSQRINDKMYDICLLSMLISVCIGWLSIILSLNPSGILRLTGYFTQLMIFALPMSVFAYPAGTIRGVVMSMLLFFSIFYFYLTTTYFSGLAPYRLGIEFPF